MKEKKLMDGLEVAAQIHEPGDHKLTLGIQSGIYVGGLNKFGQDTYVGIQAKADGNLAVIGGSGSGKSSAIIKPTLLTWQSTAVVTDIKGELSSFYQGAVQEASRKGVAMRAALVFDPTDPEGPSYDPFGELTEGGEANLYNNVVELTEALHPVPVDTREPFWTETEQRVLAAALLHCYKLGLGFSEAITLVAKWTFGELCEELNKSTEVRVKILLGQVSQSKAEQLANYDTGLRKVVGQLAADQRLMHAFRGKREGASSAFTWDALDRYMIFLKIPSDRVDQWSGAVNLMYAQLFRHLERRPEKFTEAGRKMPPVLVMMDELGRFRKQESLVSAVSTLRSKNVFFCLAIQSLAQLDLTYGPTSRRVLMDNCAYQAILRANDPETQRQLADLIGTRVYRTHAVGCQMDVKRKTTGYSAQMAESREYWIFPHELSSLKDVILITPQGVLRVDKLPPENELFQRLVGIMVGRQGRHEGGALLPGGDLPNIIREVVETLTVEHRADHAEQNARAAALQRRGEEAETVKAARREREHRFYVLGELVCNHFPWLEDIKPGTKEGNKELFALFDAFLGEFAKQQWMVDGFWRLAENRVSKTMEHRNVYKDGNNSAGRAMSTENAKIGG